MKKRFLAAILAVAMVLCVLPVTAQADTLEGLFAGKFRAGSQIFDCQRGKVSDGVWRASFLEVPYARTGQFTVDELANRYFVFKDTGRTTTAGYDTIPIVGLYLYGSDDDSPVHINGKTDETGFVNEGTINIVADEGIIYIGEEGRWGYLISNAAGYRYGDFSDAPLYLRENSIENPTLDELKEFNASDVLLDEGEILLRFYANGENVTDMPDPYYRTKTVDVDFTISDGLSPSRNSHTFIGWNRSADGSGVTYLPGAVYRSNVGLNLYAQWIARADPPQSQAAPEGVGKTNASTQGGNGALIETTAAMQYRTADDSYTWYWCGDSFTPVPAGEYWVRYAPTEEYNASPEVYVGKVLEPSATPILSDFTVTHLTAIGADDGGITPVKAEVSYEYRIAGVGNYQDIGPGLQNLSATSVEVRVKAVSEVSLASLPLTLYVKQPAAAPSADLFTVTHVTAYGGHDGSISGVNNTMRYQFPPSSIWRLIYGTGISNLPAGDYKIRYAETNTALASDYVTLTVKQPTQNAQAPSGLTAINATVYGGNGAITGTDDTMEYSADGTIWTTCSTPSTAVPAGVYSVRYRETTYAPSPAVQITITQPAEVYTITFITQPAASTEVTAGSISGSLSATATVMPGGTATLNWYACNSGGTISGNSLGTGETFAIPSALTAGDYYYCCQATFAGATTINSNVAMVTVNGSTSAPSLLGDTTMTLIEGYTATSTSAYTVTGDPTPAVSKTNGDSKIAWNSATGKLDIAAGLAAGNYPVLLTATNGVAPDATLTFTLTVNARTATQLATPTSLAWSSGTSTGTATWDPVLNAGSYSMQLYKGGTSDADKVGSAASSSTASYNFASAIAASGVETYYFKVMAMGDGINYSNSVWSEASGAYSYAAPADPPASANSISGITVGQIFTPGDTVTFTAHGGGMTNTSPTMGDKRWLPTAWAANPNGNFGSGYTQSFSTTGMTLGAHMLTVTFNQQQYNKTAWSNTGTTDVKSVAFTVGAGTPPKPGVPTIPSSTQDQVITVVVGDTATMTITATNATGYQWYIDRNDGRGFVAISGAISTSYTTSPVSMGYDGYRYYCAAPNGTPTATSPIFTLNVINQPEIPATGDKPELWTGVLLLAGAGFAVSVVLRHRKRA